MTWPFCPQCGTILDPPNVTDKVVCTACPFKCNFHELGVTEVTTSAAPTGRQAWLRNVEDEITNVRDKHAIIEEPCPKCDNQEMYFYTMQLRSVDEGQTVFYECPKCEHKFSVNN